MIVCDCEREGSVQHCCSCAHTEVWKVALHVIGGLWEQRRNVPQLLEHLRQAMYVPPSIIGNRGIRSKEGQGGGQDRHGGRTLFSGKSRSEGSALWSACAAVASPSLSSPFSSSCCCGSLVLGFFRFGAIPAGWNGYCSVDPCVLSASAATAKKKGGGKGVTGRKEGFGRD